MKEEASNCCIGGAAPTCMVQLQSPSGTYSLKVSPRNAGWLQQQTQVLRRDKQTVEPKGGISLRAERVIHKARAWQAKENRAG